MVRLVSRCTTRRASLVSVAKTDVANHCWLPGLKPDTEYTYKVFVKDEEWAAGERWDWSATGQGARAGGQPLRQPVLHESRSDEPAGVAQLCGHRRFRRWREEGFADAPAAEGRERASAHDRHPRRPADPDDRRQHLRGHAAARHSDRRHRRRRRRLVLHLLSAVSLCHQPRAGVSLDRQSRRRRNRRARRSRAGRGQLLSARAAGRRRGGRRPRVVLPRACSIASGTAPTSSSCASTRRRKAFSGAPSVRISRSTGSSSSRRSRTIGGAGCGGFRSAITRRTAPGRSTTTRRACSG